MSPVAIASAGFVDARRKRAGERLPRRLVLKVRNGKIHEPFMLEVDGRWRAYIVKPWGKTVGYYGEGTTRSSAVANLQERIDRAFRISDDPLSGLD